MKTISNAQEYFIEAVGYNMRQFMNDRSCLPAAYNLANALFNMRDWIWHSCRKDIECHFGKKFPNREEFTRALTSACSNFEYVRDVANASKHVALTHASTKATDITKTGLLPGSWGGSWGKSWGGSWGRTIVIIDGSKHVHFELVSTSVYKFFDGFMSSIGM